MSFPQFSRLNDELVINVLSYVADVPYRDLHTGKLIRMTSAIVNANFSDLIETIFFPFEFCCRSESPFHPDA